jgi:cytosine/adenosine deaminase-related metal-dependent hydrolase
MAAVTPGLVCAHHHLYSTLARGMPAPSRRPSCFSEILEQVWWRLDQALDLETLRWSAMLGALEALEAGTTTIIDHNESPNAIDGSLSVIAEACEAVGVRVLCCYGITERHGPEGARAGLAENERFLKSGGQGHVGIHACFTVGEDTLREAAGLAADLGVGVHIHAAEDAVDVRAAERLAGLARDDWLLAHGVHLPSPSRLPGTIIHNPRSNMHNAVGYARPARFDNRVVLGTDGISGDMLEEFRFAYLRHREADVTATPETAWRWLMNGCSLVPEAALDRVTWSDEPLDPWHVPFVSALRPVQIKIGGQIVLNDSVPTRVDPDEVRAKAKESARRLHSRL